jgi:sec-independent protein translocase protein TatB
VTFLSPAKILVILVVILVVLGPDKLPKVARQIGGLWADFRKLRQRLESEVRGTFPDMPSTDKISQAVRSPISFLDNLADEHASEQAAAGAGNGGGGSGGGAAEPNGATPRASPDGEGPDPSPRPVRNGAATTPVPDEAVVHQVRRTGRLELPDDPGLN